MPNDTMKLLVKNPAKSLNKAYFKQSVTREEIEVFKQQLKNAFNHLDEKQDEEYHKNVIADLFKNVYCKDKYLVNVNKREDLVIRLGNKTTDAVGVLLEFKKPTEKRDMVSADNANVKALQELILYYLRQTIDNKNHEIKHLVVTNIYDWYIFDELWFEKNIYRNTKLKKDYENWKTSGHDTKHFYDLIAAKHVATINEEVACTYFDLREYKVKITNDNPNDDNDLIDLYKILSPEHLLKKSFANDSNSLNRDFYNELLYIIGLEESTEAAKKTIRRCNEMFRNEGSLIENTISKLKTKKYFGFEQSDENENKYFEVALELSITWLNRILFLKLLESQLIKYHRGDIENYSFLSYAKIKDFDELEELFFEVLALPVNQRKLSVSQKYKDIPYLNSSLFEMTSLENNALMLSNLKDRLEFPIYKKSVLKKGIKTDIAPKTSLSYLLDFLDAYNFASESNAKIQEENKTIINAAVLGLIFEKINGYKDGSFFTPGFITMYMCRETIRKSVVEKFRTSFPKCENITGFDQLPDKIDHTDKNQRMLANKLINQLTIVDPAVGSGHFLVSALNEIIAIKSDLKILSYRDQSRVLGYNIMLENDELIVQNQETDKLFEYVLNQNNNTIPELQNLQECLFHEKQTIIENCLFGVDINPKSVMICQLRLWIELLKNAYYVIAKNEAISKLNDTKSTTDCFVPRNDTLQLQTLPNIDINIKTGNSLISKFAIKDNVFENVKNFQKKLEEYKNWVAIYKNTNDKAAKNQIKQNLQLFKDSFHLVDPRVIKLEKDLKKIEFEHYDKYSTFKMFQGELTLEQEVHKTKLESDIKNLKTAIVEQKENPIYKNAFEWRFEFPEVLNDNGEFVGFDIVIGNPPYISAVSMKRNDTLKDYFKLNYPLVLGTYDIYSLFVHKLTEILSVNGSYSYIIPNKFLVAQYSQNLLKHLIENQSISSSINLSKYNIFEEASVYPIIINGCLKNSNLFKKLTINNLKEFKDSGLLIEEPTQKTYKTLKDYGFKIQGGLAGFQANSVKEFISEIQNESNIEFTVSGGVDRYFYDNKNIRYMGKKYEKSFINKECNLSFEKMKFWLNPKIVIAGMTKKIESVFVQNPLALGVGIYGIQELTTDQGFMLSAILNSKFVSHYFNEKFKDKALAGGYLAINKNTIEKIPYKEPNEIQKNIFINLSIKIHNLKKTDPKADTSSLENDIDNLVYTLYELTDEEIEVVKG